MPHIWSCFWGFGLHVLPHGQLATRARRGASAHHRQAVGLCLCNFCFPSLSTQVQRAAASGQTSSHPNIVAFHPAPRTVSCPRAVFRRRNGRSECHQDLCGSTSLINPWQIEHLEPSCTIIDRHPSKIGIGSSTDMYLSIPFGNRSRMNSRHLSAIAERELLMVAGHCIDFGVYS